MLAFQFVSLCKEQPITVAYKFNSVAKSCSFVCLVMYLFVKSVHSALYVLSHFWFYV